MNEEMKRAPVESGTVSGERDAMLEDALRVAARRLRIYAVQGNDYPHDKAVGLRWADEASDALAAFLARRAAPPLSPATQSAELIAAADDLRHEVELLGETSMGAVTPQQYERLFASQAAYDKVRLSPASVTPSVTVEEVERVARELCDEFNGELGAFDMFKFDRNRDVWRRVARRAIAALSLPRALGRENEKP